MDDDEFSDDIRIQELESCKSIYPNLHVDYTSLSGNIDIPIKLDQETEIRLLEKEIVLTSNSIINLTPISFEFQLPQGYPYDTSPKISLTSKIVSTSKLGELQEQLNSIWKDYKDQVIFILIDHLLDITQNKIHEIIPTLDFTDYELYYEIIECDRTIKTQEFNNQTFTCEICQTSTLGSQCSQFNSCQHVFCNNCLFEYFSSVIITGDIDKVHCPDFECTKSYLASREKLNNLETWLFNDTKIKETVNNMLTPTVPLLMFTNIFKSKTNDTNELVNRYFTLFKKSQYELIEKLLPNRLVTCPRIGCEEVIFREDVTERLVQCPKCSYAFCNDCKMSYHTRFKLCNKPIEDQQYSGISIEELELYPLLSSDSYERKTLNARYGRSRILRAIDEYKMDQLFQQMLKSGNQVKACPICKTVIEKTEGCNRMQCSQCSSYFCFNCGEQIGRNYDHFSDVTSPCYRLLFFGMAGMDDEF